jgi:heme a synthase
MTRAAPSSLGFPERARVPRFGTYAWVVLGYTVFVILFGAWVRITGSGAGCGDHWPTCQGVVVPHAPATQTVIEYTHRLTSGLLGPMCLVLVVWAYRGVFDRARRRLSWLVTLFVVFEALIGALLVKKGLVADDTSKARAVVVGLHLGNTLLLTASGALLAWVGSGHRLRFSRRPSDVVALVLLLLVSMMGAVTALGDTLFPVAATEGAGMFARVRDGLDLGSHFLIRLRAVHPILATGVALWLLWRLDDPGAGNQGLAARVRQLSKFFIWAQLGCGFANVALSAPGWMQLLHLGLAQGLWILVVLSTVTPPQETDKAVGGSVR